MSVSCKLLKRAEQLTVAQLHCHVVSHASLSVQHAPSYEFTKLPSRTVKVRFVLITVKHIVNQETSNWNT